MAFLRLGALTWARTPGRFHDGEHHGHYSGLLRLPNLATMQLKYQDQFFMTAPNQRRKKAASQIPGPPSPPQKSPLPQDLPPPPCSQAAAGGTEQIGKQNSLPHA